MAQKINRLTDSIKKVHVLEIRSKICLQLFKIIVLLLNFLPAALRTRCGLCDVGRRLGEALALELLEAARARQLLDAEEARRVEGGEPEIRFKVVETHEIICKLHQHLVCLK